ncbi:TBC1 domain family member 23-like [Gigantopelta aegis]|uniref:TBC1 domain family member 23-like n=1 Tax=Gigantopelta aegis TaxID=1735272 RepID=UPI001B88CA3D|nr:TBC1 domain family member 23-like [Gigantopelta aegis]
MAEAEDDNSWITELETALVEECDFGSLRNICKGRPVPDHLRSEVWQICLNVHGKGDALSSFNGLYDMDEQTQLREDCSALVDKLGNDEEDKVSIVSDLESIITFYCKSRNEKYTSSSGWLDLLQPLLALKLSRSELYNCFYALVNRYIPRDCVKNGKPFHLFRLLLQYHDPELCSFLDTKRITADMFAQPWFRSMFAASCDLKIILKMWDVCLQHADPFLSFFLALVILVNAREMITEDKKLNKREIIEMASTFPSAIESEDIEDFCTLAQYYASKTPQSFRRDFQTPLFGTSVVSQNDSSEEQVSQALCLPVSVGELMQANQLGAKSGGSFQGDGVRYFVVDCRPADQYNSGHLPTAFHLDANLMLQNPEEFSSAVQALWTTQKQAIAAGSVAGGEHLCFMGSGREEEDQYVNMVVANFLQKGSQYVSIAKGGYSELHQVLRDNLSEGLADHNSKRCIICCPDNASSASDVENGDDFGPLKTATQDLFGKLSIVVKSKSVEMKEKFASYMKNEQVPVERHISNTDRLGKRYRNMANVFTIGDDDEGDDGAVPMSSDDEHRETVSLDTWLKKPEVVYSCQCQEVREDGYMFPSHLLVTSTHLYILRDIPNRKGMVYIMGRRALGSIVKITSKKKHPDFITLKYGTSDDDGFHITNLDRFIIPRAGEATKIIKQQIIKVLDALDS